MPNENLSTRELIESHKKRHTTKELIRLHKEKIGNNGTEKEPKYSKLGSFGIGALDSGTFGLADEIGGAVGALNPSSFLNKGIKKSYQENRDKIREEMQQAQNENPGSYGFGNLTGSIASVFIPGMGWMNAAKGAKILQAIGKGGGAGALIGAGNSNADLTKGEIQQFSKDVGKSALIGGAVGGAAHEIGKVAKQLSPENAAKALKTFAGKRAVKSVTGGNIGAIRSITGTTHKNPGDIQRTENALVKTGNDLLEEPGVMGYFSKSEEMAPRLERVRKEYGAKIGDVAEKVDEIAPNKVSATNIARKIREYADTIPDTQQALKDSLEKYASVYDKIKKFGFKTANDYKQSHKFSNTDADAVISNADATNKLRSIVSQEMENTLERLSIKKPFELTQQKVTAGKLKDVASPYNPELDNLLNEYMLYKQKYGSFKNLSNAATDRYQKNLSNRFISPSDYAIGSAAGTAKALATGGFDPASVAVGATAGAINKIARERGSSFAARAANKVGSISDNLAKVLKYAPQRLGKFAAPLQAAQARGSLAAVNFVLQQTQPEYRKLVLEPADEENEE